MKAALNVGTFLRLCTEKGHEPSKSKFHVGKKLPCKGGK